jgi:CheY-like chemotaxis protein
VQCKPLLDTATKDLFRNNAFRITGLSVEATRREEAKHADELKLREELGQSATTHAGAVALNPPPTLDQIREATGRLKDPEKRLIDEFFWFWPCEPGSTTPDPALEALASGNADAALKIWTANEPNPNSGVVATHNIALFWQLRALDLETDNAGPEVNGPVDPLEFTSVETRQKILQVDDDPDLLDMYREILVGGLPGQPAVQTANSGPGALAMLEAEPFDLLICDLKMPKMDGLQVLALVRQKYPQLRTVLLTAETDERFRLRANALGVDLFWHNPATEEETKDFLKHLQSLLGGNGRHPGPGVSRSHSTRRNEADRAQEQTVEKYWRNSLKRWKYLTFDDLLWDKVAARVKRIDDPRLTSGFVRRMRATLPLALAKVNAELALVHAQDGRMPLARIHVQLLRESNDGLAHLEKAAELVLTPARKRLQEQIKRAQDRAKSRPQDAASAARELLQQAQGALALYDLFFEKDSDLRNDLFEEVASACNRLQIAYHNATSDDKTCLEILELVRPLATSTDLRQSIEKDISETCTRLALCAVSEKLKPIHTLCEAATEAAQTKPASADKQAHRILSAAPQLLSSLSSDGLPRDVVDRATDEVALAVMHCAVVFGNKTDKWKECIPILERSLRLAVSADAKNRVIKNLQTAQANAPYADLASISSAPSLSTINGIGLALYGSTDNDPATGSYLATYYFVVLWIPIFPICRYRVTRSGDSYRFFGQAPLRPFDKCHLAFSIIGLITALIIGLISPSSAPTGSPSPSPSPAYTPPPAPPWEETTPATPAGFVPDAPGAQTTTPAAFQSSIATTTRRTYQIPSSVSAELETAKQQISIAKAKSDALDTRLATAKQAVAAQKSQVADLQSRLQTFAHQIDRDRIYLDRTSQPDIDAFNANVNRYNTLRGSVLAENATANELIESYNTLLEEAKAQDRLVNQLVDNHNAKLQQYGR